MITYRLPGTEPFTKSDLIGHLQCRKAHEFPITVTGTLDISFAGHVDRTISDDGDPLVEYVILTPKNGKAITVERKTTRNEDGVLGVTCSPDEAKPTLHSINISFRDHDDPHTDRGIVWVMPGEPATLLLQLDRKPEKDKLQEILDGAEKAVESKLLQLFLKAA